MKRILLFLIMVIFLSGCATIQLPELTVKPASQYRLSQNKEGLVISVDPFLEKKRVEELFGTDLLSKGILPVLVVVENNSNSSTFYLQKEQSSLEMAEGESETGIASAGRSLTYQRPDKATTTLFYVSPLIVAGIWQSFENEREAITKNMIKNELRERTLNPGESQHGLIYFRLTDKTRVEDIAAVNLKVLNIQSKENILFSFTVE
ncbi:MAG: hypothetical protein AMJ95_05715 [Omnitrophica WOR_2 bacterium SM23_72]|nr:MAG: hypothetical protein AMJ95_05715 [Omnitrophica WOR_2 bacterium SM23_72]